jgi:putative ABC transport system ATP-binding protein
MGFINVLNVSKRYNPGMADEMVALSDVSLSIEQGSVTALTGPSGSGKTSLLSLIGCMARPTEGRIQVAGRDVAKLPERFLTDIRRRQFGFIFQQFHLIRELTVLDNVVLPLFPLDVSLTSMKTRGLALLEDLGLGGKINLKIKTLSGGEQQRVAIARALINTPDIIIADEPTAHLDRKLAHEFLNILEMLKGEGKTIVIATHDPFIYEHRLIDTRVFMEDGRILQRDDR